MKHTWAILTDLSHLQQVNPRTFRQKALLFLLILSLVVGVAGCTGNTASAVALAAGQAQADAANNQAGANEMTSQTIETAAPTTVATTAESTTVTETTATEAAQTRESSVKPAVKEEAVVTAATTSAPTAPTVAIPVTPQVLAGTGKINILLIGSDARAGLEGQRSDSTILLTYDREKRQIKLTSFMRDSYVAIPGHGSSKMNAAFNYGGESLLLETVRNNFAVDVEHYMTIRFEQFVAIVDQIGGISLTLSQKEIDWINGDAGGVTNGDGVKILNGAQALSHSRNRYVGNGDFTRTARQRAILQAIFSQIKQTNNAVTLAGLVGFAMGNVKTNVPADQLLSLAADVLFAGDVSFAEARVPFDGAWSYATIKGASVIKIDFATNNESLSDFLDN
ncbi:MAG: LCP family protein [Eubacteriales bacterium]|nr:LCP family protein [Eubacteriales bacterium]